ncbi:hypothetical protein, partial [Natrarchaeobius chitinivorans]
SPDETGWIARTDQRWLWNGGALTTASAPPVTGDITKNRLVWWNSSYLGMIAVRLGAISAWSPSQPVTKLERMVAVQIFV